MMVVTASGKSLRSQLKLTLASAFEFYFNLRKGADIQNHSL